MGGFGRLGIWRRNGYRPLPRFVLDVVLRWEGLEQRYCENLFQDHVAYLGGKLQSDWGRDRCKALERRPERLRAFCFRACACKERLR